MQHFTDQKALTVIAEIDEACIKTLEDKLKIINLDVETNSLIPFCKIAGIHFCRFLILPDFINSNRRHIPHQLVYSSNFDHSLETHLREIKNSKTSVGFEQLFSCCTAYNKSLTPEEGVEDFIRKNKQKVHTYYRGHRGFTVELIQTEKQLYKTIQTYLESQTFNGVDATQIKKSIDEHVQDKFPDRKKTEAIKLPHLSAIQSGLILLTLLILPVLLLLLGCYFLGITKYGLLATAALLAAALFYLRYLETHDEQLKAADKDYDKIRELTSMEDKIVQNQLTHLAILKKGFFRKRLQRLSLRALNLLSIYTYNKGRLGNIGTIHFARWMMIDKGERLLFFSNFDGSWENYLGDFVDRAARGLTLAWSNNKEFPDTKWLILKGAENEELFKSWARKYQLLTQVWYSAYKDLTLNNIYRNHNIALGIGKNMTDNEIKDWMKLL
jgi:hypothetical protein